MASFKEAFRAARLLGDDTFEWNGKKYTTEVKEPSKKAAASNSNARAMAMADEDSAAMKKAKQDKGAMFAKAKANFDATKEGSSPRARAAAGDAVRKLQEDYEGAPGMKKGGLVRGCGIAKRGFGKAMKRGSK